MVEKRSQNTESPRGKHAAPQHAAQRSVNATPTHPSARGSYGATKQKKRRLPTAAKVIIGIVIAAALAVGIFLVWDYLFRYDDAKDIQGQWKIEGSNSSIIITDSEIRLTDSVSFEYELDTFAKTLTYRYMNFSGEGMYVFSPERDVLTLTDVATNADEGDGEQSGDGMGDSMRLLKVSNQAVGEPESANNNDTADANTQGVDVLDGSVSSNQAQQDIDDAGDGSSEG